MSVTKCEDKLVGSELISYIKQHGLPESWSDTEKCQQLYTPAQKGWQVKVYWDETTVAPAGTGVFADQDIPKHTVLRKGIRGKNIYEFNSRETAPVITEVTKKFIGHYILRPTKDGCPVDHDDNIFFWLPGCAFNHSLDRNNVINVRTNEGVNFIATRDIKKGDEILADYNSYGKPPKWFSDMWSDYAPLECAFPGMNSFVKIQPFIR